MILPGLPGGNSLDGSPPPRYMQLRIDTDIDPLTANERGVVLSLPVAEIRVAEMFGSGFQPEARVLQAVGYDRTHLRALTLFYDYIVNQSGVMGELLNDSDLEFLESANVFKKAKVSVGGKWPNAELARHAETAIFRKLDRQTPGRWVIGSTQSDFDLIDETKNTELTEGHGLLIKLFDQIPVPAGDVPLADILNFKQKRRPELLALRYEVEHIYGLIADQSSYIQTIEFDKFSKTIADYEKVMKETLFSKIKAALTSNINVNVARLAALAAGHFLAPNHPAIVGLGTISLTAGFGLKGARKDGSPFRYIGNYHDDLPWFAPDEA